MSGPWDDYAAPAEDGPWSDYAAPVSPRKTSQSLGFMKGLARPLENAGKVNPVETVRIPGDQMARDTREKARQGMHAYFGEREQAEKPGMIGEIAGNIFGTIPAMAVTKNPFVGGALQGAALTDADSVQGVAADAAGGAALNWFGGKAVNAVADFVAPAIAPAVRRMSDAGVKLTPGMVKGGKAMVREDKRMSRPVVGDAIAAARQGTRDTFNTATVNEALKPLGKSVPTPIRPGHETVDWAHQEVSRAYDVVIRNLQVKIDGQRFAANMLPHLQALPAAQRKEFQRLISVNLKNGQLSDQALKNAQSELRRLASGYSSGASVPERELGKALHAADDELTAAMISQNPKWGPELQKVNRAYRGLKIVEGAAKGADEGVFNTGQLKTAVRQGDRSRGKSQTARGQAYMQDFSEDARKVIPARTPDSGTAGRQQAGSIFAKLGGAADLASWNTEQLLTKIAMLPRPQQAVYLAELARRLKAPAGAGAVALAQQPSN